MKYNKFETFVGLLVLVIAGVFFSFAYKINNRGSGNDNYSIIALFQNIDGIESGADVKISGIKIGSVDQVLLKDETYDAVLMLKIQNSVKIPKDSTAVVSTSGLLGGRYIKIVPGGAEEILSNGQKITLTQSALSIEDLIGKFLYYMGSK
jgi:phospholipid/cholesterol/gamma-HCH transport system substrate-binding protein